MSDCICPRLKRRMLVLFILATCCFAIGFMQPNVFGKDPVPFDPNGGKDVYSYLDVHYAWDLVRRDAFDHSYFMYTYVDEIPVVFKLTKADAIKYNAAIYANDQRMNDGDESVLEEPPIFRLQGYSAVHDHAVVQFSEMIYGMSEAYFQEVFGTVYLSKDHLREIDWLFLLLGMAFLIAFAYTTVRFYKAWGAS